MRGALLALLLTGCCLDPVRYQRWRNPANPFPVRKVAVCPVLNQSGDALDPLACGERLASELTGFQGFEVIWPRQWASGEPADLGTLLARARAAGADAVLLAQVTESSPYPPPKLGLAMALYPTAPQRPQAVPYEELIGAGRPLTDRLPRDGSAWLGAVGAVYDAQAQDVQDRLHAWGLRRDQSGASFDWKRGLYSRDEFMRFCFNESLRALVEQHKRLGRPKAQDFPKKKG